MTIRYLDDQNPDGAVIGTTAASLLGFWGATPVVQPTLTLITTATATTTLNEKAIGRIITALASIGLVVTA